MPTQSPPRLPKDSALECVRQFFALPIQHGEATAEEGVEALDLAIDYAKGHYDMTYLRLAQALDCHWCTADEKVLLAVPPDFPADRVLLLSALRD